MLAFVSAQSEGDALAVERAAFVNERKQWQDRLEAELSAGREAQSDLEDQLTRTRTELELARSEAKTARNMIVQVTAGFQQLRQTIVERLPEASPAAKVNRDASAIIDLNSRLTDPEMLRRVRDCLTRHYGDEMDPNLQTLFGVYEQALSEEVPYWDIRIAVRTCASLLQPDTYLEVGARRGWSLAQVFAEQPRVRAYVFECWAPEYGGFQQGTPEYLRGKMREVSGSCEPRIEFIHGDSHSTLLPFFSGDIELASGPAPQEFDLVAVDGDHTRRGAWWDLDDLFPRVAAGGCIVFDDLDYAGDDDSEPEPMGEFSRPALPWFTSSLTDVWLAMQRRFPNFVFFTPLKLQYRCGLAFRLR